METALKRAAEYLACQPQHQQYSIANQSAAIRDCAQRHSISVVRTYADRGKSGLALNGRPGLQTLLTNVISGRADFSLLLVYDVSRWGRFQDVDESAYYEYLLKRAGVNIIYCAEPFSDAGTPSDAILKTLKRAMAAEYSRELSVKVSDGQRRISQMGYRVGGLAGYGFQRVAVDPNGSRLGQKRPDSARSGAIRTVASSQTRVAPGDQVCGGRSGCASPSRSVELHLIVARPVCARSTVKEAISGSDCQGNTGGG